MKQNQKIILAIGLGVVILLNVVIFGWLLADFFIGPNEPAAVSTTDSFEEPTLGEEKSSSVGHSTEEPTTEEPTTEEPTTEEPTTEEPTTEEPTSEETTVEWIEKEIPVEVAKRVIHTFSWGEELDQLGYAVDIHDSRIPRGFAVENDTVLVWDDANRRILSCKDDQYSVFGLGYISGQRGMKYQNGWIGIVDQSYDRMVFYRSDGSVEMSITYPKEIKEIGSVQDILEIGETYVVVEIKQNTSDIASAYRYDWTTGSVEWTPSQPLPTFFVKQKENEVIGVHEEEVYYKYAQRKDNEIISIIVREAEHYRLYTELNRSNYRMMTSEWVYLSTDGCLYIMECFEDRIEISELVLDVNLFD